MKYRPFKILRNDRNIFFLIVYLPNSFEFLDELMSRKLKNDENRTVSNILSLVKGLTVIYPNLTKPNCYFR